MSKHPFIKVCGQTHAGTVDASLAVGARYIGFIFHALSPRSITPERAACIASGCAERVGVFVSQGAPEIIWAMRIARLQYAQLHGKQSVDDADAIGAQRVIRVLWPQRYSSPKKLQEDIDAWAEHCAMYLLDAGDAPCSGGTGRTLEAERLADLRFPHPWILAGGLRAENIPQLVRACHPDGLDLNSGVETAPGLKDPVKLLAAVRALDHT